MQLYLKSASFRTAIEIFWFSICALGWEFKVFRSWISFYRLSSSKSSSHPIPTTLYTLNRAISTSWCSQASPSVDTWLRAVEGDNLRNCFITACHGLLVTHFPLPVKLLLLPNPTRYKNEFEILIFNFLFPGNTSGTETCFSQTSIRKIETIKGIWDIKKFNTGIRGLCNLWKS